MTFGYRICRDHDFILEQQRFKWLRNVLAPDGGVLYKRWSAIKRNHLLVTALACFRGPYKVFELSDRSMRILGVSYTARPSKEFKTPHLNVEFTLHNALAAR